MIKHLKLLKNQNMMDINVDLLHWFINVLTKKLLLCVEINLHVEQLQMKLCLIKNFLKNYTNKLLKSLKNKKYRQYLVS